MSNELTRRSFVKWGTATAGATALAGLTSCAPAKEEELSETGGTTQDFRYPGEKGRRKTPLRFPSAEPARAAAPRSAT